MFKSLLLVSCCAVVALGRPQEESKPEDTIKRMERQVGDIMDQMDTKFPFGTDDGGAIAKEFRKIGEMAEMGLAMMSGAARSARSAQKPEQGPPQQSPPNGAPPHAHFRRLVKAV